VAIRKGIRELCAEADAVIESWTAEQAIAALDDPNVQLVDIRDVRELWREGAVPGAFHAPRGMLEFWVDPESPYAKPAFQSGKRFVFFCGGGLRSALATRAVQEMGLAPVCHVRGGFAAWKHAGGPIVRVEPPSRDRGPAPATGRGEE